MTHGSEVHGRGTSTEAAAEITEATRAAREARGVRVAYGAA